MSQVGAYLTWTPARHSPAAAVPVLRPVEGMPAVSGRTVLSAEAPAVVLNRRQSAIGSMEIKLGGTGLLAVAWELTDTSSGVVHHQNRAAPPRGGRPVVEYVGTRVLVALRHVHQVRRLLVIADQREPGQPTRLVVSLYGASGLDCSFVPGEPTIVGLAVYQVRGQLVLRREDGHAFPTVEAAAAAYDFSGAWA